MTGFRNEHWNIMGILGPLQEEAYNLTGVFPQLREESKREINDSVEFLESISIQIKVTLEAKEK